jgi:predicted metal-dependent HD superfamily phosphohydrolase
MGAVESQSRQASSGQDQISPAARVHLCWDQLGLRQGWHGPAAAAHIAALLRAYGEPHRHYHTLDHIGALLMLLDRHIESGNDRDALSLAILYHDVVYEPARQDNEAASAAYAARHLAELGFPTDRAAKVNRCILATRHGQDATAVDDADMALLLDLDLSTLAAPGHAYRSYAQAVRQEYIHVPDALYRAGRKRVLESFLTRESIYLTDRLRVLWERSARANLAAEIATLA